MVMKLENYEVSNLPVDVINSIRKLELIIKIIEENIFLPKEDILREVTIKMGDLQSARKIFSLYYPIEGVSLSSYIVQRKKTEAIKAIKNIENSQVADKKIKEITGWSRVYFNRIIKEDSTLTEVLDISDIVSNINFVYDNLYKLDQAGIIRTKCKRTKVIIDNIDWNRGLRTIFSMREYISLNEEKDMKKLISYDMFLKNYEWMEDYIKTSKEYNPMTVIDYYAKSQKSLEEEEQDRIMDFIIYYTEAVKLKMGDITYYCVNRERFREVIDEFILPEDLFDYRTIIYKTRLALRIMGKKDSQIDFYIDKFKSMLKDNIQREVFSFFITNEESNMEGTLKNIYQLLHHVSEEEINLAIKNLILKGFISLKPSNI